MYPGAGETTITYDALYAALKRYLTQLNMQQLTAVCHLARKTGAKMLDARGCVTVARGRWWGACKALGIAPGSKFACLIAFGACLTALSCAPTQCNEYGLLLACMPQGGT
jgi:hypothetical protein